MTLTQLGWNTYFENLLLSLFPQGLSPQQKLARVVAEHRNQVVLSGEDGEMAALPRTTGFGKEMPPTDGPSVGDWVVYHVHPADSGRAIIERVLPRKSCLIRQAAGSSLVPQVPHSSDRNVA